MRRAVAILLAGVMLSGAAAGPYSYGLGDVVFATNLTQPKLLTGLLGFRQVVGYIQLRYVGLASPGHVKLLRRDLDASNQWAEIPIELDISQHPATLTLGGHQVTILNASDTDITVTTD